MLRRSFLTSVSAVAIAAPALAADLPPPPPPPVPIFTWTGIYVGGQIGYAFGNDNINIRSFVVPGLFLLSSNPNGVIGGGHLGYNLQIGQWVAGIEGDVDGTNFRRTSGPDPLFGNTFIRISKDIEGSVRGRVGIAWDRALLYATGGVAFAGIDTSYSSPVGFNGFSRTRVGFTVGGGIEYAITNNWSLRAEYRFSDFGRFTDLPAVALAPGIAVGHRLIQNRVQAGFSYKFDFFAPAPVVAAY